MKETNFNKYLKKYENDFITFRHSDNIIKIKCRFGEIQPFSLSGDLCFYGKFPTPNKKAYFLKKLSDFDVEITQDGYDEVVIAFSEQTLPNLLEVLEVRKRMKLSEEEKERRRILLDKVRAR